MAKIAGPHGGSENRRLSDPEGWARNATQTRLNVRYAVFEGERMPVRSVQQSGHDDRPEGSNEMSAAGERDLAAERRGRVGFAGGNALVRAKVAIPMLDRA